PASTTKAYEGLPSGRRLSFRQEDVDLLRARIPEIAQISAEYERWGTNFMAGRKTATHRLAGVEPEYGDMRRFYPQTGGRFLNETDLREKRRVVFLGNKLAEDLFGKGVDPTGQEILIQQTRFLVIGVLQKKMQTQMYSGPDADHAVIPSTTFIAM